ncbi:MAG: DNA-binding protein [Spirochaetae bacterium HGW-Spirochaetae-1]|jgi:HEPN domain-containing protein|nr:MAG: DNA-binding protein [Spirochaetae bacterium HGW-Spirochaetae-1]
MDKKELINYWKETSDRDYGTMRNLYKSGDYHWSLFMGHLVIEKLLKALYVKNNDEGAIPPRTHDLAFLAERSGVTTSEEMKDALDIVTTFNINARYPDYRQDFYRKCSKDYTGASIEKIEEIRKWLISLLEKI